MESATCPCSQQIKDLKRQLVQIQRRDEKLQEQVVELKSRVGGGKGTQCKDSEE